MIFSALIQYSRMQMDAQSYRMNGQRKKAREVEKNMLGVGGFVRGGLSGPSEFFLPMMAIDTAWTSTISDDPLFSAYRYSGLSQYGFPAQSFISKSADITADVFGSTVGKAFGITDKERDITQSTVHKARLLLPFQNFIGLKHFFNLGEKEISDAFNLAEQQPRRSRD